MSASVILVSTLHRSDIWLTWFVQWLKLALLEGANMLGVSPLTWEQEEIQFPKRYSV
jgi:hypothetical protein